MIQIKKYLDRIIACSLVIALCFGLYFIWPKTDSTPKVQSVTIEQYNSLKHETDMLYDELRVLRGEVKSLEKRLDEVEDYQVW